MKELLLRYASYNSWANTRISDLLKSVAPDIPDTELKSSFSSIRKTVYHIWDAETIWLKRLRGEEILSWPSKQLTAPVPIDQFVQTSHELHSFLENKDADYFALATTYKNTAGETFVTPNYGIVMHVFNHSTFHRGQIVTMLRETGYSAGIESTDLITFLRS